MGKVEEQRKQGERLYLERVAAARRAMESVQAPSKQLDRASLQQAPKVQKPILQQDQSSLQQVDVSGLLGTLRDAVAQLEAGADPARVGKALRGKLGALARSDALSPERRGEIASKAGKARRKPAP